MSTKAATFSSKIRNLNDYYNNIVNCSLPVANTCSDITSTLKYFSQALLTILKDVALEEEADGIIQQQQNDHNNNDKANLDIQPFKATELNKTSLEGSASNTQTQNEKLTVPETVDEKILRKQSTLLSPNSSGVGGLDSLNSRLKKFPNLNYTALYHSLMNIIEIIPTLQTSQIQVGQALIHTFSCLAPFLPDDIVESLPYNIALTMITFPKDLQKYIVEILCNSLIPIAMYTINNNNETRDDSSYFENSLPSILMLVMEYGNDTTFNVHLFECLLCLKKNFVQDVLCTIAYGSFKIRYHATNLLFRYWPKLNPNKSDRNIHYHFIPRRPIVCQSEKCAERRNQANKVCIDPNIVIHGHNSAPPYYVCNDCYKEVSKNYQPFCNNLIQPSEEISLYCENRNCKATDKLSHVICYASPCILANQNKPITLCKECHQAKHRFNIKSNHVYQTYLDTIWKLEHKTKSYLTTTIVNLLKEVPLTDSKKSELTNSISLAPKKRSSSSNPTNTSLLNLQTGGSANYANNLNANNGNGGGLNGTGGTVAQGGINMGGQALPTNLISTTGKTDLTNLIGVGLIGALNANGTSNTSLLMTNLYSTCSSIEDSDFNKRLLSRFGCYLIISLVDPKEIGEIEIFGHLISMVLQWFHLACYMPSDYSGDLLSKIRTQHILPWIKKVTENHFELVVSCLLPFPPDFAQVGGVWETKSNKSLQIKSEFAKFSDLMSFDIVSYEIWDYVMPYWIEAIQNDVNPNLYSEFKIILGRLFEPDMSPFSAESMIHFVSERFEGTPATIQEQALSWLEILCELDVFLPLNLLLSTFHTGLNSIQKLEARAMRRREALSNITTSSNADFDFNQLQQQNMNNSINPFTVFDTYEAYRVYRNQLMLLQMTGQELAMLIKEEEEDFIINNTELNITCCIMMLDMILKQFELQKYPNYLGMYNLISKEILLLLSKQLILPWTKKHKCKQQFGFLSAEGTNLTSVSPAGAGGTIITTLTAQTTSTSNNQSSTQASIISSCPFCEEYLIWFSFGKDILSHISPKLEIELPDINFVQLFEAIQVQQQQKQNNAQPQTQSDKINMNLQLKPIVTNQLSSPEETIKNEETNNSKKKSPPKKSENKTDPEIGIWVTSYGVYYFKFSQLSPQLQCLHSMLKELYRVPDLDAYYNLLQCIKLLILHGDCLEAANKEQKGFLIYCLEKLLIPSIWKLLSADYCHLNEIAVGILVQALLYESGQTTFWNLVERDFRDSSWKIRMQALSKCINIAQNLKPKHIKSSFMITSSLAFAFSFIIGCMHDVESLVAQKAVTLLETLTDQALRLIMNCFETQFDFCIKDRIYLLELITKLYSTIKNIKPNKTNLVLTWDFFINRFNTIYIESQLDTDVLSPVDISGVSSNQRKINIAKFSLKRSDFIRSISNLSSNRKLSNSSIESNELDLNINNNNNNYNSNLFILNKEEESKNLDQKIIHVLITLLMKFLAYDDQSIINDDRILLKHQNLLLKHLYSLIKYNINEKLFTAAPHTLREMSSVNAFLSNLPMVLDRNFSLGTIMLPIVLRILRYLPLPAIEENTSFRVSQLQAENAQPNYTIGLLNIQARYSWINTLIIVLYKYQYNSTNDGHNLANLVKQVLKIAINTLDFQFHYCDYDNNSFSNSQSTKLNLRLNLFEFDQVTREKYSEISKNSIDLQVQNINLIQARTSSASNLNNNNNHHQEIAFDEEMADYENDENQSNKSVSDKSSNKLVNFSSPSKIKITGFKSSTRSKSRSSIKSNLIKPIQSSSLATVNKKSVKSLGAITNTSKQQVDLGEKKKNKSKKSENNDYDSIIIDRTTTKMKIIRACPFNITSLFNKDGKSQTIELKKNKKTMDQNLINRDNTQLPNKSDSISINNINPTHIIATSANAALSTNQISCAIEPGVFGSRRTQAFTTNFSIEDGANTDMIDSIENQNNLGGEYGYFNNDDIDSDICDDDLIDNDEIINQYSNYKLIMNSNTLLSGEYGLSYKRCLRCNRRLEHYGDDSIAGLIVACATIVHRECTLAAPLVIEMIMATLKISAKKLYSWQVNNYFYYPGNYSSVAKQFIRCILHQLVQNEIFYQLFQSRFESIEIVEAIAVSLNDFNDLNSVMALRQIFKDLNFKKNINMDTCMRILNNTSIYIEYLPNETQHAQWTLVIQELETFFRHIEPFMIKSFDYTCLFNIMSFLLKVPVISANKTILEPFSKILCFILRNCLFKLENLIDICSLSNRAFTKDRDRQYLPKCIVNELIHCISVKVNCIDRNLLLILQLALLDAGGNIYKSTIIEQEKDLYDPYSCIQTNISDCLKQHINEIITFIGDIHTLTRIKQNLKIDKLLQTSSSSDSLGAQIKAGLAQFLALEFTELNKSKDRESRSIVKYLPWLSNLPSNAQQGAKDFVDCIDHIRFLSWILIGSLTHSGLTKNKGTVISYPIPISCGHYIGEHIFYILNGFAEHSKTSAIHMSSLFHSFILCQLWTMYCEQIHVTYDTENDSSALNSIMEFWTKITPGILSLLSQTKVLADMVILHFLSLIEGLQEYNSLVLAKFFPMWVQVLFMSPLQGEQLKRAKQCLNYQPPTENQLNLSANYGNLVKCLQRLQYKIAMIEMQSSNAAQLLNN